MTGFTRNFIHRNRPFARDHFFANPRFAFDHASFSKRQFYQAYRAPYIIGISYFLLSPFPRRSVSPGGNF